jgi:two-component system, chemotaxis family, sensor kinase CheA
MMDLIFDISEDEMPVFMAEADEHLQSLDEGLVRLEREGEDPDLVQALFRSAHTLKGSSGMIGHKRMVELTHAMETAMDCVRKGQIKVTPPLIDVCLEAVDVLRALCDEVILGKASGMDIKPLVSQFVALSQPLSSAAGTASQAAVAVSATAEPTPATSPSNHCFIRAEISPDSVASAARAFQLMLALQDLGEVVSMDPDQAHIETAEPVQVFCAELIPSTSLDEVRKALSIVSEVDLLTVSSGQISKDQVVESGDNIPAPNEEDTSRLGDYLVQSGLITAEQLQTALDQQTQNEGPLSLLGHTLVQMGFITHEVLDEAVADRKQTVPAAQRLPEKDTSERGRVRGGEKTVRTSVERLDNLMNLVGELITDRNRMYMLRSEFENSFRGNDRVDVLSETITHVGRITDQLQAEVMGIRMLPISNVFNKFPRLIRDLARKADKQIDLVMKGENTELDRSVIEVISDPLIHLLRNSVDHGIEAPAARSAVGKLERGTILLTARHEQGRIIITVEDDGRGIDTQAVKNKAIAKGWITEKEANALSEEEAIDLIFIAGLSTARVVSDISGRGVGMDIVRNNIERLNGSIHVESWPGKGSKFSIVLPLTLAIMPTLLVRVAAATYAIPLVTVTETLLIPRSEIQTINSRPVIRLRNHVLPVVRLTDAFALCQSANGSEQEYIVVVRSGKTQLGLIVDALIGEQEVVVKSLSSVVGNVPGISGAAILGDGQVALIADVQGLLKLATNVTTRFDA